MRALVDFSLATAAKAVCLFAVIALERRQILSILVDISFGSRSGSAPISLVLRSKSSTVNSPWNIWVVFAFCKVSAKSSLKVSSNLAAASGKYAPVRTPLASLLRYSCFCDSKYLGVYLTAFASKSFLKSMSSPRASAFTLVFASPANLFWAANIWELVVFKKPGLRNLGIPLRISCCCLTIALTAFGPMSVTSGNLRVPSACNSPNSAFCIPAFSFFVKFCSPWTFKLSLCNACCWARYSAVATPKFCISLPNWANLFPASTKGLASTCWSPVRPPCEKILRSKLIAIIFHPSQKLQPLSGCCM